MYTKIYNQVLRALLLRSTRLQPNQHRGYNQSTSRVTACVLSRRALKESLLCIHTYIFQTISLTKTTHTDTPPPSRSHTHAIYTENTIEEVLRIDDTKQ